MVERNCESKGNTKATVQEKIAETWQRLLQGIDKWEQEFRASAILKHVIAHVQGVVALARSALARPIDPQGVNKEQNAFECNL